MAVGSFADGSEESWVAFFVFDFGEGFGEFVGVDQLGVSEHGWRLSEVFFDELGVHVDLVGELFLGVDVAEGVEVGLGDELAAACFSKLDEEVEDIGAELFPLVDDGSGDRVGEAEVSLVSFDEVEHELGGGAVALVGDLVADLAVGVFVEVEGVGVEDGVWLKAVGLVDLEVEVDGCHVTPRRMELSSFVHYSRFRLESSGARKISTDVDGDGIRATLSRNDAAGPVALSGTTHSNSILTMLPM